MQHTYMYVHMICIYGYILHILIYTTYMYIYIYTYTYICSILYIHTVPSENPPFRRKTLPWLLLNDLPTDLAGTAGFPVRIKSRIFCGLMSWFMGIAMTYSFHLISAGEPH